MGRISNYKLMKKTITLLAIIISLNVSAQKKVNVLTLPVIDSTYILDSIQTNKVLSEYIIFIYQNEISAKNFDFIKNTIFSLLASILI